MSETPGSHHYPAMERGADCARCPLVNKRQGPVLGEIRPSRLLVVGEAPGGYEVEEGRPFIGPSGDVLDKAIAAGGVPRHAASVTNAILCRPLNGGDMAAYLRELKAEAKRTGEPLVTPQDCCAPRLARDVADSGALVLLAVGGEALKALAHGAGIAYGTQKARPGQPKAATIKKQHGSPIPLPDGRILAASLHPAFAMHGDTRFGPVIEDDLRRAAAMAVRGSVGWYEPEFILAPQTPEVFCNVLDTFRKTGARVTVDIETDAALTHVAKIRCVGLGITVEREGRKVEFVTVVPLRRMNGDRWWTPGAQTQVENALAALLNEAPLAGHNLLFDTAVLLRHGLMRDRTKRWFDTMLAHKDSDQSELPHDLGFVAARTYDAPRWKEDADAKSVDGVDDLTLHRYCAKDVLGEMRLVEPLAERVVTRGQGTAFGVDSRLAPVARDMGDLGLVVDDAARKDIYGKLDAVAKARLATVRDSSGVPDFNPNASKQIARFLYVTQGLTPPFTTDGDEWGAGEDDPFVTVGEAPEQDEEYLLAHASTNRQALLKLLELGVDDRSRTFINAIMGFRQMEKIKSTFVGLAPDPAKPGFLLDTHRDKRFIVDEQHEGFGTLPVLHTSWKLHVVPSGRWASQPACQNWPERVVFDPALYRSTGGEQGIVNTRRMVVAPPGHVIVGADYNAVELRLYASMARDAKLIEAFNTGKDAHALNFASMMAKSEAEIMVNYERVKALDPKEKKAKRNIAKRFCIAEGESVLTERRGLVPIEQVLVTDRVWDGVEWVTHDGVVMQGVKEVVFHDGLWATEDHEVWTANGWKVQHGEAAVNRWPLMRSGEGTSPVPATTLDGQPAEGQPYPHGPDVPVTLAWRTTRTYDLLNAGPRHRFTVSGRLVSNCYLIIYGGQRDKLFKTMAADRTPDGALAFPGLKEREVAFWFDNWHQSHPETSRWQKGVVQSWMRDGFIATKIYGRRRFFIGGLDPNAIVNHGIQGTAADIANRAMLRIAEECPHRGWSRMSGPILQVHDFIGLQVPLAEQKRAEALLETAMPWHDGVLEYGIELKSGPSWADV